MPHNWCMSTTAITATAVTPADILDELGAAYRGDWSDFDGRSLKSQLQRITERLRAAGNEPLTEEEALEFRIDFGLCEKGHGRWWNNCYECDEPEA